jgi:opacity protein-like surface antigen
MKKTLLLIFLFGFKEAWGASAIINKIYQDRIAAQAVVLKNKISLPGDFYVAKFQGGNVCYLEILKVRNNLVLLDLRLCSMKNYLDIAQKLGDSANGDPDVDIVSIAQPSEIRLSEMEDFWKDPIPDKIVRGFSLLLQYSFADSIDFTGTTPNSATGAKNAVYGSSSAQGAPGLGIDYLYSRENHFGWNFNGSLEFPRNFNYLSANTIGEDFNGSIPDSRLWLGILALNLNFTFPKTYIPYVGINFSLPIVTGGDLKLSSQIGFQAGLSKLFGKNLIIDVEYRWLNFQGGIQIPGQVIQFTSADFFGFLLRAKYLFN